MAVITNILYSSNVFTCPDSSDYSSDVYLFLKLLNTNMLQC